MKRKLSSIAILTLLGIQLLSSWHIAAFGVQKHEHNSIVCGIFLHHESIKFTDLTSFKQFDLYDVASVNTFLPLELFFTSTHTAPFNSRDPPFLS